MKKAGKIFTNSLAVCVLLFLLSDVLLVLVPRFTEQNCFAISGGSMEPSISKGDLVITQAVQTVQIQPGDVLTFRDKSGKQYFTHRVVSVDSRNGLLFTRGDANQIDDPTPTSASYVVGRVVKTLPLLGWPHLCLSSSWGLVVVFGLVLLWLISEFYFIRKKKYEKT